MNSAQADCGSSSCIFSANGGMRTNGPCRCYENAGFHGSAVMAARQMLPELLKLRAAHAWIRTSERMPDETCDVLGVVDGVVMRLDYSDDEDAAYPWADDYMRVYANKDVSHWMPLPEAPK